MTHNLTELAQAASNNSRSKGFQADIQLVEELFTKGVVTQEEYHRLYNNAIGMRIALIHSEASELLECFRKDMEEDAPEELSDGIIRYLDLAGILKYDILEEVLKKMAKNAGRPHMHERNF